MDPDFKAKIEKQKKNKDSKVDSRQNDANCNNLSETNKCSDNTEKKNPNNTVKLQEDKEEDGGGCC